MKKSIQLVGKVIVGFILIVVVFLLFSVAPIDPTLPVDQPFYSQMMRQLDSVFTEESRLLNDSLQVGFGKASITPSYPTATAGYVKRKGAKFTSIHDSVFVRSMMMSIGSEKVAIVSLDMLIVPPLLFYQLEKDLPSVNLSIDQVYLGATHTHNSFGQWDDHLVGEVYAGDYDGELLKFVSLQIVKAIQLSENDLQIARIKYGNTSVREAVTNRLVNGGPVDPLLHIVEISREDSTKGIFTSFSAHATCLSSADLNLSRDYPGILVDKLESSGYDFALFMAGAVGSHAPVAMPSSNDKADSMASMLTNAIQKIDLEQVPVDHLDMKRVPLLLGKQQIKILPDWRVREWLSLKLMGEHVPSLTRLRIGNLSLLGTPCDFSGMLTEPIYREAQFQGMHALVTSFNGGYIGYITPDELFDLERYETQTMNWYGPGNGSYLQSCLKKMIH